MNPRSWISRKAVLAATGAVLAMSLFGATGAFASGNDSTRGDGWVCPTRDENGRCVLPSSTNMIWNGKGWTVYPQTAQPSSTDTTNNDEPRWWPVYWYQFYGGTYAYYYPYGGGTIISPYNIPAPTYVVVTAAADALGVPPGLVYAHLKDGRSLSQLANGLGMPDSYFLSRFSYAMEQRITETLNNGTLQQWQANALRSSLYSGTLLSQRDLLTYLATTFA